MNDSNKRQNKSFIFNSLVECYGRSVSTTVSFYYFVHSFGY